MTNRPIRKILTIGKDNYDVLYKSRITGNIDTFDELRRGKWAKEDKGLQPAYAEPFALRRRHTKEYAEKLKLIVDEDEWVKDRCPRCFRLKVTTLAQGREKWELGNNYPVLYARVDFGGDRIPRIRKTSKYCECCNSTYVAKEVKVARWS